MLDPVGLLDDANRAHERRRLSLNEDRDGLFILDGLLDPEGGLTLKTALEALLGPKAKDDRRSAVQRRADALTELARRQLQGTRGLPEVGGQRPHLTLMATVEALQGLEGAAPARLEGVFPVPEETARRLSCDAAVTPLLLDGEGNHLDLGRTVRTVPPALRRALVARDRGCRFPDCDRPPEWCEGHHLDFWIDGGETNKDNVLLLCSRHHRLVHEGGWRLSPEPGGELVAVPP